MKKIAAIILGLSLMVVPVSATAFTFDCFTQWFTVQSPRPPATEWKTTVKKATVVPPASPWQDFKRKAKPVEPVKHEPKESSWSKWKFWNAKHRGKENEPKKFVTDERTTTEPIDD